jgi:hypothetical protein
MVIDKFLPLLELSPFGIAILVLLLSLGFCQLQNPFLCSTQHFGHGHNSAIQLIGLDVFWPLCLIDIGQDQYTNYNGQSGKGFLVPGVIGMCLGQRHEAWQEGE